MFLLRFYSLNPFPLRFLASWFPPVPLVLPPPLCLFFQAIIETRVFFFAAPVASDFFFSPPPPAVIFLFVHQARAPRLFKRYLPPPFSRSFFLSKVSLGLWIPHPSSAKSLVTVHIYFFTILARPLFFLFFFPQLFFEISPFSHWIKNFFDCTLLPKIFP